MKLAIWGAHRGLSAKLLGLTLGFIMLAEVLVFLPSIGRALQMYGEEMVIELERGALAFEVLRPDQAATSAFTEQQAAALQGQLLADTGWQAFAARLPSNRSILAGMPAPARVIDLQDGNLLAFIGQALGLVADLGAPELLRVSGLTRDRLVEVDIWLLDTRLRAELRGFAGRILLLSLGISIFAAALVYLSLRRMIVEPIERLRGRLAEFALAPHDATARVQPSLRRDEIGYIEAETRAMQETIANTLQQKERLAALGSAVAQVNHDLRGMLSTALLLSDSLESSKDPRVAKAAPILASSIERAVDMCAATLKFATGGDQGAEIEVQAQSLKAGLRPLIQDWSVRWPHVRLSVEAPPDLEALYDTGSLHRILDNLARNAVEAGSSTLTLKAERIPAESNGADPGPPHVCLTLVDTGPGIAPKAEADLFVPFKGSTKREGTGLGVANAAKLAEAMGGALSLEKTDAQGTIFALKLAAPVVT